MKFSLINFVNQARLEQLKLTLEAEGFLNVLVDGSKIFDTQSFFSVSKEILPLDPPLSGKVRWEALSDSLWNGIEALGAKKVAIIWTHVENMLVDSVSDLVQVVLTLVDVSRQLYTRQNRATGRIDLLIFLVGNGTNFK